MPFHCLRERPLSLGPVRVPKNILVVTMISERRIPSSLITRPLDTDQSELEQRRRAAKFVVDLHLDLGLPA